MPIIVCLKEPAINLVVDGEIKDDAATAKEYDEMFPNIMVKDQDGHNVVIPLDRNCSIAFIKEVTQEDIDRQRKESEKRREEMQRMGARGPTITRPQFVFPTGRGKGRG